jgi:hypothetical protein
MAYDDAANAVSATDFAQTFHVVLAICTPHRRQWPRGQAQLIRECEPDPLPAIIHRKNPPRFALAFFARRTFTVWNRPDQRIFSLYATSQRPNSTEPAILFGTRA